MKFDDIKDLAKKHAKLDHSELATESMILTNLKVEWNDIYVPERLILAKLRKEYKKLYLQKWQYYLGKAPDEVYIEKPLDLKIMRQDVSVYLEADEDLQTMETKIELQEAKVDYIKEIIDALKKRGFDIKNAIEYIKFTSGA